MSNIEIRPRFSRRSMATSEEILHAFEQLLEDKDKNVRGFVMDQHIYLKIPKSEQHYWSPQLNLEIIDQKEGTKIRGVFGPRPSVWLMYLFFYFVLGFGSVIIAIMGFSQMNLGLSSRILWLIPVLLALIALAYSTAQAGQRMGLPQMELLYKFFDRNLPKPEGS
ncbi:MAG: hypothetical protein MRZ79_03565 [Bacteroidia bacterium]|nr:hypothetical protein [Bacteroidia bacterium]